MQPARALPAALLIAAALTTAGCGGDSGKDKSAGKDETVTAPAKKPASTEPLATTKAPPSALLKKRRRDRSEVGIQTAVTKLVSTAEQGDGAGFCRVLGLPAAGTGPGALEKCAHAAGVPSDQLPTSDELSIQKVQISGSTALVTVVPGTRITLRKHGGAWVVRGVTVSAR